MNTNINQIPFYVSFGQNVIWVVIFATYATHGDKENLWTMYLFRRKTIEKIYYYR